WSSADNATLNIFTTIDPTSYRVPTLMHDHVYRMGVAWQNVAYNQPPHLGYYLPDRFKPRLVFQEGSSEEQTTQLGEDITPVVFKYLNTTSVVVDSTYTPNGVVKGLSSEFTRTVDYGTKQITLTGKPTVAGDYTIVLRMSGNTARPGYAYEYVKIHVDDLSGINDVETSSSPRGIYTVSGVKVPTKQVETLPSGMYVVKGQQGAKKVMVK
ncbi:MAG: rhamnogalacturonan lyase, partial [Prevotella sp.]|nr:rhamnogalacturonan lyase [Prevotella sp.]